MSNSRSFFRNLTRVNAILIFLALSALLILSCIGIYQTTIGRPSAKPQPVAGIEETKDSGEGALHYQQQFLNSPVGDVQMSLKRDWDSKGLSSGGGSETVNILFLPANQPVGRWLLPDNRHILGEPRTIGEPSKDEEGGKTVATAVMVSEKDAPEGTPSRLLLFSPTGDVVVEISKKATEFQLADLNKNNIVIVYAAGTKFMRAMFDRNTLAKISESEIAVPKLK